MERTAFTPQARILYVHTLPNLCMVIAYLSPIRLSLQNYHVLRRLLVFHFLIFLCGKVDSNISLTAITTKKQNKAHIQNQSYFLCWVHLMPVSCYNSSKNWDCPSRHYLKQNKKCNKSVPEERHHQGGTLMAHWFWQWRYPCLRCFILFPEWYYRSSFKIRLIQWPDL